MSDPSPLLIKNGRIVDPASGLDAVGDLLIRDGRIDGVGGRIDPPERAESVDATDRLVVPGLIDMHVHLRDPGFPEKETVETGCRSAAAGGFTAVACMPNTDPLTDTPEVVREILAKAESADARVYPVACISADMQGSRLTDTDALLDAGAVGFSDDGLPVESDALMRELFLRSQTRGFPVCPHTELMDMTRGGHMHEGSVSASLGIKGMPAEGEAAMVERDIELLEEVGGHLHVLHISVRRAIDLVRKAKARGLSVTSEAGPHHFTLIDEDVLTLGTAGKMSPPLRSADDREAVLEGLADGTIDAIASDHAPHTPTEKLRAFPEAPNGIIGLETVVGLTVTRLVEPDVLTIGEAIAKLTIEPARILGIEGGVLSQGARADVTVIDPMMSWPVDAQEFQSKSRNSPFHGWTLRGRAILTVLDGRITHRLPA
ncbi:MAG: dihydroorotase [Candidatus Latescibacteria bacterium]|jgi:dihydroorotase|nr:dihydroorotase [Candidatus Latescibacterota bacterium]